MIRELLWERRDCEKTAVIENGKKTSYRCLFQRAAGTAAHLSLEGDVNTAVLLPGGADFITAVFAVLMRGQTAFPLSHHMKRDEIIPLLSQAHVKTVISSQVYRELFEDIRAELPELRLMYIEECGAKALSGLSGNPETAEDMLLLATSGSTGKPRIVRLSEKNIETSLLGYLDRMSLGQEGDSCAIGTQLSSAYGLMIIFACLKSRCPLVVMDERFTLSMLYKTIEEHKVSHYEGGAAAALLMEQTAGRVIPYDIGSLRYFGFGGSGISAESLKALENAFPGISFKMGYGMTEASPLIAKFSEKEPARPGSSGSAIKGVEAAIEAGGVISDTPYVRGEIVVRGGNVTRGYYNNGADTKRLLKNGYLYTGDIGYLDSDGYLYVCGRKKNIIIVRGFNVCPEEVEGCIMSSGMAVDCMVYGETKEDGTETICAKLIPANSGIKAEDIRSFCGERLSDYKLPRKITFVSRLEKTAAGKLLRKRDGPAGQCKIKSE